jgi:CubicO group peptidase (beta-lactamase class C family)
LKEAAELLARTVGADGKWTLDTRVANVLPELKAHYPDVTLRHFTTMTSGYRAVGDETTSSYKHGLSNTPFIPNPKPLFTPPGSQCPQVK